MKQWWQPPQLRLGEDSEAERRATWLELFYDLVFVVAIAQLAHNLNEDVSLSGFFGFVALFIPVWWSWIGAAFYVNRFDTDGVGQRLLTALQMLAVGALAVNVHHGLGESSAGFALAYAAVRAVLVMEYLWAGRHVTAARSLTRRYARGFGTAAAIWFVSAFVPMPFRFGLWAVGLAIDFATPISAGQLHAQLAPNSAHLPERFGLFTLIVLGETVVAVVNGVAEQPWNFQSAMAAALGFGIAFSFWWVYFDNLDASAIQAAKTAGRVNIYQLWLYAHLLLVIGLTATGVGIEHTILSKSDIPLAFWERWLICGAVALCFLALSAIHRTTVESGSTKCSQRQVNYRLAAAVVVFVLAIVGAGLLPAILLGLVAVVCGAQVGLDLYTNLLSRDRAIAREHENRLGNKTEK
jgi:low temperature requirement protein LtrA